MEKNFEILSLPSKGKCYPHKKAEVSIAYMTAIDENILVNKDPQKQGQVVDALLKKKILDSDFTPELLCETDRNYILLWLYRTSYGDEYVDPLTKEKIDLSQIEVQSPDYVANQDGYLEYVDEKGVKFLFRLSTHSDELFINQLIFQRAENIENDMEDILATFLKRITIQVDNQTDNVSISRHIDSLSYDDKISYLHYLNNNEPNLKCDINFDNIFYSVINTKILKQ